MMSPARYHLAMGSVEVSIPVIIADCSRVRKVETGCIHGTFSIHTGWCEEIMSQRLDSIIKDSHSQVLPIVRHQTESKAVVENDCKDLRINCGPNYLLHVGYYQNQLVSLSTSTIVNAGAMQQCWTCTSSQRTRKTINRPSFLGKSRGITH